MNSKWDLDETVCYCPQHDEITIGMFKEHYCSHSIYLGQMRETYVDMLECEIETLLKLLDYEKFKNDQT